MELWPLIFLFVSSQAQVFLPPRNPDDAGAAVSFQNQDLLGQYDFGYTEGHPSGATFRRETGDALGNKVGAFGLRDVDGRVRVVRYVADSNGFRAEVTSNEPGVAPQDPASATINKPSVLPVPDAAAVPTAALTAYPPPPVAPVPIPPKVVAPPPVSYNYIATSPVASVPLPPPPPPPAYYPPRFLAPAAAPVAVPAVPKAVAAYQPPPPPPAYYNNVIPNKAFVGPVRGSYASLLPPFAAVPPQFNYLNIKSPPAYPAVGIPL